MGLCSEFICEGVVGLCSVSLDVRWLGFVFNQFRCEVVEGLCSISLYVRWLWVCVQ